MINILICDDDKKFCQKLENDVEEYFSSKNTEYGINTVHTTDRLDEAVKDCDILLLDVMINGKNSINLIAKSNDVLPCEVIIITSYPGEIYNISCVSPSWYVDKIKYKKEHLFSGIDKCINNISKAQKSKIVVACDKMNKVVDLRSVMYIETQNKNIKLYFADGTSLVAKDKMSTIIESGGLNFQQCSRCYAVNFDYVTAYFWHKYILQNKTEITISRSKYKELIGQYKRYLEV